MCFHVLLWHGELLYGRARMLTAEAAMSDGVLKRLESVLCPEVSYVEPME